MNDKVIRILHGHVDAGLLRLRDEQVYSVRFQRDPMPLDHERAVLIILPKVPGADTLLEFVGMIALENEQLKRTVANLEEACQGMASDLVTRMDDPDHEQRTIDDDE